ncbi:MAG TPA: hypothetical protein VJA22_03830 [Patescibacteria group bacterium]|nr:hypothetical protein [Patescibacteria group bacterium]
MNKSEENSFKEEILEAIQALATHMDQRFDLTDLRFDRLEGRVGAVESRLDGVESRLDRVEATMVTKDYLDDKLADLRGDLVVLMRKEDKKLDKLVDILADKKVISDREARTIYSMEPFSRKS